MLSTKFLAIALLCVAIGFVVNQFQYPANYESRTAAEKLKYLMTQIKADNGASGSWPSSLQSAKLLFEDLTVTGSRQSDFFPEDRLKLIHSVGAIAQAKFVWNQQAAKYTGLFKAANYGLVRASCGAKPGMTGGVFSKSTPQMVPGLSFKFLRNGIPSANFMAMWQLDGQKTFNFFNNPFSNHVARRPDLPLALKLGAHLFDKVSSWSTMVGLSDFATYRQDGTKESDPQFPFTLIFQPSPVLRSQFANNENPNVDEVFPRVFSGNEALYRVFAVDEPISVEDLKASDIKFIGTLQLASPFYASKFADSQMFFKHQFMDEDLAQRDEWNNFLESDSDFVKYEGAPKYQDLLPAWKVNIPKEEELLATNE